MPQIDLLTLNMHSFWLIVGFGWLYWFFLFYFLPIILYNIKIRFWLKTILIYNVYSLFLISLELIIFFEQFFSKNKKLWVFNN